MRRFFENEVLFPVRISVRCDVDFLLDLMAVLEGKSAVPSIRILHALAIDCCSVMNISSISHQDYLLVKERVDVL